ncbi:MAG TPA: alpha/beta hydrolase [Luteibacter sp.]|uniref:alpha/beta hydrolase n=1 Tax=Luteibacter sp. TaxID=1886636 RepID=UPI002C9C67F5|nr:alpha/beta hydrolase [Luteibacter sp.]HVI56723.1 alpha/beta hydrolase [Luteibacter sp.]
MLAALDADDAGKGTFTVGLVRVKAGDPAQRRGSLFFNFGGPGANPTDMLPPTAYLWSTRSASHPLDGDKRRLADRFDLVAVIPRGLRGGSRYECKPTPASDEPHDPSIYLADWNWAGFVQDARAYARACDDPLKPHLGTLQHVRDMEQARLALGEPAMNFVGISYGTWVGAFYAAMYPHHAGRIVLDSVMNFSGTFEQQVDDAPGERQALFARNALRPALADPFTYNIGSDARTALNRFRAMPHEAREAWSSVIDTPSHLVAALTLADWMRAEGAPAKERLIARAKRYVFSPDPAVDHQIRQAAVGLASALGRRTDPTLNGLVDISVYHAVICADTPWRKDPKELRALANRIASRYPAANGEAVTTGLVCMNWATSPRWRPPLTALAVAPPMLMVQAEFDPATSYNGAMQAFSRSPGARMVVAQGARVHGLFGASATPCVERAVGRFLLDGELPALPWSACDYVPSTRSRESREAGDGPSEWDMRDELAKRLQNIR